jgi:dTDP-4-dehydrorhamnose 3,5-epimerase
MRLKLTQTAIPEVVMIEPTVFVDERGWFMESFQEERFHRELRRLGLAIPARFVQDNHSLSKKNVLRGLHYQRPPHAQGKLVRVAQGAAYDVAVDIREGSPTFGCSVGIELSAKNKLMLWIPPGFAHGFIALEEDTHFLYKTTDVYSKECEASLRWDDPCLKIKWPLAGEPILSEKDRLAPFIDAIAKMPYSSFSNSSGIRLHTKCVATSLSTSAEFRQKSLVDLQVIGDQRGKLIVMEQANNIPFDLKRAYYIFDNQSGMSRGFHAHKRLMQFAVCVSGKCRMVLDDGKNREDFWLDSLTKGLLIGKMVWREMHDFSENCVLIVFASDYYDEADYIRDYKQFIETLLTLGK